MDVETSDGAKKDSDFKVDAVVSDTKCLAIYWMLLL